MGHVLYSLSHLRESARQGPYLGRFHLTFQNTYLFSMPQRIPRKFKQKSIQMTRDGAHLEMDCGRASHVTGQRGHCFQFLGNTIRWLRRSQGRSTCEGLERNAGQPDLMRELKVRT